MEKCQPGMLPTDKRSEEKSLRSLALELPITGHVLLKTDNQDTCWLSSAREGVRVRRAVRFKYPDKVSCLAVDRAHPRQLPSRICPPRCPPEGSWSLLPTQQHLSQHRPERWKKPQTPRLFRGSSKTPQEGGEGWTCGPDPISTISNG